MLWVQLGGRHHSWSVRLLLGPRSQVCQRTMATIMLCGNPPQTQWLKAVTLYPMARKVPGATLPPSVDHWVWVLTVVSPLPEGSLGPVSLRVVAEAQEGKKKHAKLHKVLLKTGTIPSALFHGAKAKGRAQCHKAGKYRLPVTRP